MTTNESGFTQAEFDVARAVRAQAILSDPMVQEALAALKSAVRDLFFETAPEAAAQREQLHLLDRARQHFESVFTTHILSGDVARASLLDDAQAAQALADIQQRVKER